MRNGLKIQWINYETSISANAVKQISLPLSIGSTNPNIQITGSYENSANGTVLFQIREISANSISIKNIGNSTATKVFITIISY